MNTSIPVNTPYLGDKEKQFVADCMDTGWISSAGKYVNAFEADFARYCDCAYGVTTTNGTSAIHLALKSLGIGSGDEVLIPSFTMAGSVYPIIQCGATPVFVDSELETYNLDVNDLAQKITPSTKAILVVHIYGHPADMDPILALAKKFNLYVIEDAAEAHGATYKGKKVGGIGDVGCFSFYANKIITTGEGGMIVSNNQTLIKKARQLKDLGHGDIRFTHELPEAYNYRLTNLQAAIGLGQLQRIDEIIQRKITNAALYNALLSDIPDFILPSCKDWAKNVYWMYGVFIRPESRLSKNEIMRQLEKAGIGTRSFFHSLNEQPAFAKYNRHDCPNAILLGERGFYLPSGQTLTEDDIKTVCEKLHDIVKKHEEVIA